MDAFVKTEYIWEYSHRWQHCSWFKINDLFWDYLQPQYYSRLKPFTKSIVQFNDLKSIQFAFSVRKPSNDLMIMNFKFKNLKISVLSLTI